MAPVPSSLPPSSPIRHPPRMVTRNSNSEPVNLQSLGTVKQRPKKQAAQPKQPLTCTGCGQDEPPQDKMKKVLNVFDWILSSQCHHWWHDLCGGSRAADFKKCDWLCPPCHCKLPDLVLSSASEGSSDEDHEPVATAKSKRKKTRTKRRKRPTAADFFSPPQSSPPQSSPPQSSPPQSPPPQSSPHPQPSSPQPSLSPLPSEQPTPAHTDIAVRVCQGDYCGG